MKPNTNKVTNRTLTNRKNEAQISGLAALVGGKNYQQRGLTETVSTQFVETKIDFGEKHQVQDKNKKITSINYEK